MLKFKLLRRREFSTSDKTARAIENNFAGIMLQFLIFGKIIVLCCVAWYFYDSKPYHHVLKIVRKHEQSMSIKLISVCNAELRKLNSFLNTVILDFF